jgi:hypothetical protein
MVVPKSQQRSHREVDVKPRNNTRWVKRTENHF